MRDYYGRRRAAQNGNPLDAPMRYETEITSSGNTEIIYTRFENNGDKPCAIWKETVTKDNDGNTTAYKHEYAFEPWANRTTATYVPINDCWTIN